MLVKILAIFISSALILIPFPSYAEKVKDILIVYEGKSRLGEDYPILESLERYLKHFNVSVKSRYVEEFDSNIDYNYIIYLGFNQRRLSRDFLKALSRTKNLIWVEANIKQYADYLGWKNFKDLQYRTGYIYLIYKGIETDFDLESSVYIAYPQNRQDLSFLSDYNQKVPLVWKRENLWYFGRLDFKDNSFLVFFDLLHDILDEKHTEEKKVLVLLDDINPLTSPERLRELLESSCCEEVPTAIVIYPNVKASRNIVYLKENDKLVNLLKEVSNNNWAIVQGSYNDKLSLETVNNDLTEIARLGIYPIAFKLPYNSSTYDLGERYFRLILSNQLIKTKSSKIINYPINLERYDLNNPKDYAYILQTAKDFKLLRDAIIGITIPSYTSIDIIRKLLRDLRDLGYSFLDLSNEPFYVENNSIRIVNSGRKKVVSINIPTSNKSILERIFDILVNYLRPLLIIVVSLFTLIIIYLILNKRKLYEGR